MALACLLPVGVAGAPWLAPLNQFIGARTCLVFVVMGLMALPIPFGWIRRSIVRPWPALLASLINMVGIPLIACVSAWSLSNYLGGGLIIAATIPCTLASAAVWTRRAGGDDSVAILVTLITNLTCVLVTPLWLVLLVGHRIEIQVGPLIEELVVIVLMPIALAQFLRLHKRIALWAEHNKQALAVTCQIGILVMVFLGAIQMGVHLHTQASLPESTTGARAPDHISALDILWVTLLTAGIHLIAMAAGWFAAARTGIARPQQIGVAISGSQKTLMIGLKMAMDCGVSILPMVTYHVGQLLIDTLIADRWRHRAPQAQHHAGSQQSPPQQSPTSPPETRH